MGEAVTYQDILRRLAIVDEGLAGAQAGLMLGLPDSQALDPKMAAGATEDEITGVLLAVAPVIGLGRIVAAAPGVAGAFGYDIDAALEEPRDP